MFGWIFILSSTIVTWWLYVLAKVVMPASSMIQLLIQVAGLFAIVLLSWSFVLATRLKIFEKWFGGLDSAYSAHHIVGGLSTVLTLSHFGLLLIKGIPQNLFNLYVIPGMRLDYTLGQMALYILILLIVMTFYVPLPYYLWKWTHEWMGVVMILSGLHAVLVSSDVANYLPMTIWISSVSIIGVASYLYKRFGYYFLASSKKYVVVETRQFGQLVLIKAKVIGDAGVVFKPGQYGFFSLAEQERGEHPFTIWQTGTSELVIAFKLMANFTQKLRNLQVGSELIVRGPYGTFADKTSLAKHMVWVAGGIGITPFRSMTKLIKQTQQVEMLFCSRVMPDQVIWGEFARLAESSDNFRFLPCETNKMGRLSGYEVFDQSGRDTRAYYFLCGPNQMMEQITAGLIKSGVKRSHIIYEDFGFK